jgi:hypothetical protein
MDVSPSEAWQVNMTADEYRQALLSLSPEQFEQFGERLGGGTEIIAEERVEGFAYADDVARLERIIVFRLRQLGVSNARTEDEKLVWASEQAAMAANASAAAAELSARTAASSTRWTRWSVVVSAVAVMVAILTALVGG